MHHKYKYTNLWSYVRRIEYRALFPRAMFFFAQEYSSSHVDGLDGWLHDLALLDNGMFYNAYGVCTGDAYVVV